MSLREDLFDALACGEPLGAVPIWEIEFQAWDAMSGRHVVLGEEFERLSAAEQDRALHENAEILLTVVRDLHFAALTVPGPYWHQAPGQLAYYVLPGEARLRQAKVLREMAPPELVLVGTSGGVLGMPDSASYLEFSYQLYDAPDEVEKMAVGTLQGGLEAAARLREAGCEIAMTASDLADNHGPFFPPAQFARFLEPYLRAWAEGVHALGMPAIMHSDGDLRPVLEALADSGLDALQAVDPTAGMEMAAAKAQVEGRLCLCGNVDCGLLLTGTPEAVYAATVALLEECKGGGGLVLGASNAVQAEVPVENYRAMIEAWKERGRYGCRGGLPPRGAEGTLDDR